MNGFRPGRKVLFHNKPGSGHIGTIVEPYGGGWIIALAEGGNGTGGWFALPGSLSLIPDGAPILTDGTRVQVAPDAPHYANRVGYVYEAAARDGMFGYWLHLAFPEETVWVPALALAALTTESGETR